MSKWMNKAEAAMYAGISRNTLEEWIAQGLYYRKLGKRYFLNAAKIDEFIDTNGEDVDVAGQIVKDILR